MLPIIHPVMPLIIVTIRVVLNIISNVIRIRKLDELDLKLINRKLIIHLLAESQALVVDLRKKKKCKTAGWISSFVPPSLHKKRHIFRL